jgi:hypothetical protein
MNSMSVSQLLGIFAVAFLLVTLVIRGIRRLRGSKPLTVAETLTKAEDSQPLVEIFVAAKIAERQPFRNYGETVRNLFREAFNLSDPAIEAEQNRLWEKWLNVNAPGEREPRDLLDLLREDIKDSFKARALAILLTPDLRYSPFTWREKHSLKNYLFMTDLEIAKFSAPLKLFLIRLICLNVDRVLESDYDEKLSRTLFTFNKLILNLLADLDENDPYAQELFDRYLLNDPVGYWSLDEASGYNPFNYLLSDRGVPEKWKRLADNQMRERILAEEWGKAAPRHDWEKALENYASHLNYISYGKELSYGTDFFASQLEFILDRPAADEHDLIRCYNLQQTLRHIAEEKYRDLRHKLARYAVLEKESGFMSFKVYNEETTVVARQMLAEFGEEDKVLAKRLNEMLAEGEECQRAQRTAQAAQEAKVGELMTDMKNA